MSGTGDGKASKSERLGYLGLGMMGVPMAQRLINAGFEVAVWNRSADKANGAAPHPYGADWRRTDDQTLQSGDRRMRGPCRRRRRGSRAMPGSMQESCLRHSPADLPIRFRCSSLCRAWCKGIHSPPLGHIATILKDLVRLPMLPKQRPRRCRWQRSPDKSSDWARRRGARISTRSKSTSFPLRKPANPRRCRDRAFVQIGDRSCSADPRRPSTASALERN
jgi:hypothetical protein